MPDSMLFAAAASLLSFTERVALSKTESRLENCAAYAGLPTDGERLAKNVRAESRLVGNANYDDPSAFTSFLRRYGDCSDEPSDDMLLGAYERVCLEFERHGLPIRSKCLPDHLLRYTTSSRILSAIIRRVLGVAAQIDFDMGRLSPSHALADIATFWSNHGVGRDEMLGSAKSVFATFEDSESPVNRDDPVALGNALALPLTLFEDREGLFLYEFRYPSERVTDARFPTVADAGTFYLFRPCVDVPPHRDHPKGCVGYTEPLESEHAQPELLHSNTDLGILSGPPRFVGSFE